MSSEDKPVAWMYRGKLPSEVIFRPYHDAMALFDGWTETPLYEKKVVVSKIVAWLRWESVRIQMLMDDDQGMTDMRIGVQLKVDQIADLLESGRWEQDK